MIFKSVTIHNLFSYHGEVCFDLARPEGEERNIVVIKGRNGYGKTSFLNSVKLLFGGVTKELMAGVQRGSPLSQQKSFVLGTQEWWGIMNHKARANDETRCGVSAVLLDDAGQETRVTRNWNLLNGDYKGRLTVSTPRKLEFNDEEAQQYLSRVLPLDYIPFFFFDAEEVGYLAEANRNQTIEKMEQLLNIRPVDNLQETLKEICRELNHLALGSQSVELCKAENRHEELMLMLSEWEQERERILGEIDESEDEIRRLQQKIRLLRGTGTIENAARLEAEKRKEEERLAEALSALSTAFEHDAFLRINPHLAQKAMQAAESCASSQGNAISELLGSLKDPLKEIFTTPPYPDNRLNESQVKFYQARMESRNVSADDEALFQIETGRAKKLANLLAVYLPERLAAETI